MNVVVKSNVKMSVAILVHDVVLVLEKKARSRSEGCRTRSDFLSGFLRHHNTPCLFDLTSPSCVTPPISRSDRVASSASWPHGCPIQVHDMAMNVTCNYPAMAGGVVPVKWRVVQSGANEITSHKAC